MAIALDIMFMLVAAAIALPLWVFALECFAALLPSRQSTQLLSPRGRAAVLIPAHNEAPGIAGTIESLLSEAKPGDRIVVIADNCTDETASIARAAGAEVTERFDSIKRGKGFALDHGVRYLEAAPPDVVLVVDADCRVSPCFFDEMVCAVNARRSPIQCVNLTVANESGGGAAVAVLANRVINLVRPTGLANLGGPCRLLGTGMAFPWEVIQSAKLATGSLVEDMKLGIDLAVAGHDTRFERGAMVTSLLPPNRAAFDTQRARWESGHLQTFFREAPRLAMASLRRASVMPFWLVLHLCVPALSLLFVIWMVALAGAIGAGLLGASLAPASILGVAGGLASLGLLASWFVHCREQAPFWSLAKAPLYVIAKAGIYLRLVSGPRPQWVRTRREAETHL